MSLFGLSPLLLTIIAGKYFKSGEDELNVTQFTRFLSFLTLIANLIGSLTLDVKHAKRRREVQDEEADEETPLIMSTVSLSDPLTPLRGVLKDPTFWLLAFIVAMTLGTVSSAEPRFNH